MADGRMLKRRITASKKMAALKTDKARLLWFYLLPFTDVDGRIIADCEDIRDEIIRKQRKGYSLGKIEECLQDLYQVGLIALYVVGDVRYLEITRFWDEQSHNPDREAKSPIPAPTQGTLIENSESTPLKLSKVKLSKEKYKDFVFLSFDEYNKLVEKYNKKVVDGKIEDLNDYIGEKGKKYKSHYYTLNKWLRKDQKSKEGEGKNKLCIIDHKPGHRFQNNADGKPIYLCRECLAAFEKTGLRNWGKLSPAVLEKKILEAKAKR